jgi:uncharacterized protein
MDRFWENKSFEEMSLDEWESLCDHCGKCCLHKFEDEETGDTYFTNVACKLLDVYQCRCTAYQERFTLMPSCVKLTPEKVRNFKWLPRTCAYRLIYLGEDLEYWHPLISGNYSSVVSAGISIRGKVISEKEIDIKDLESYIVDWLL